MPGPGPQYSGCETKEEVRIVLEAHHKRYIEAVDTFETNGYNSVVSEQLRPHLVDWEKNVVRAAERLVQLGVTT